MKHRKNILMLLTLMGLFISPSVTLYAQQNPPKPPAGTDGVKNMIISGALNTGRMHRFVEQCGASPELLAKYKASFDADTVGGEKTYRDLGIDIQAEFDKGRKEGENEYAKVSKEGNKDQICNQAIEIVGKLINNRK